MPLIDWVATQFLYKLMIGVISGLVILTLASQFGKYLYLELTTHFRLQYLIAAVVCALLMAGFQSWKFAAVALLCGVLNAVYLLPYFGSKPQVIGAEKKVRIFHANVLWKSENYEAVLALIRENNPDVVVLQELSEEWGNQVSVLGETYPNSKQVPLAEGAGMAIFSRYPLTEVEVLKLDDSPHIALRARVDAEGETFTLLALHPTVPLSPVKFVNRNRQFKAAAELLNSIGGHKVVIGDLNTTMWSPYFTNFLREARLRDGRVGFGLQTSWPVPLPSFLRLPIDHCLASEGVQVDRLELGVRTGSDHHPLIVDLSLLGVR